MNAVVFDLELIKRFKKGQLSEIVEIGACKVDLRSKIIKDQFQIYIAPKAGYVAKSTRKFINMKKEDVKNAVPFHVAIQKFSSWIGDQYYMCSWGKDDRYHLINQCYRHKIKLDWLKNYNDIQKKIGKILTPNINQQLGLKNAMDMAGIEPIGKAHRGIDDAINTAELLVQYIDQIKLEKNFVTPNELAQHDMKIKLARLEQRKRNLTNPSKK